MEELPRRDIQLGSLVELERRSLVRNLRWYSNTEERLRTGKERELLVRELVALERYS